MVTNMHRMAHRSADSLERADIVPHVLLGVAAACLLVIYLVAVFATHGVLA